MHPASAFLHTRCLSNLQGDAGLSVMTAPAPVLLQLAAAPLAVYAAKRSGGQPRAQQRPPQMHGTHHTRTAAPLAICCERLRKQMARRMQT